MGQELLRNRDLLFFGSSIVRAAMASVADIQESIEEPFTNHSGIDVCIY